MPAPIHIVLTEEEDRTLSELRVALTVPQRTRIVPIFCVSMPKDGRYLPLLRFSSASYMTRQQSQRWQEQGLFIFFLPAYCSEINRIESEWH